MADAMFDKAWQIMKRDTNPYKTRYPHKPSPTMEEDIDAAVDSAMKTAKPKKPKEDYSKPAITGFKTTPKDNSSKDKPLPPSIQNLLDRARDVPRKKGEQKRPDKSKTSELPTQTLQNLHRKVRGDE